MKTLTEIRDELVADIEAREADLAPLRAMLAALDGEPKPAPKQRAPREARAAKPKARIGRPPRVTIAQVETEVRGLGEFTPVQLAGVLGVAPSTVETKLREMRRTFGDDLFDVSGTGPERTLRIRDLAVSGTGRNGGVGTAS